MTRDGWVAVVPSGRWTGIWHTSSVPQRPSRSVAWPPRRSMSAAIWGRTSDHRSPLRGAAKAWNSQAPSEPASMTARTWPLCSSTCSRSSRSAIAGTRTEPRSARSMPSPSTWDTSNGPVGRRPGGWSASSAGPSAVVGVVSALRRNFTSALLRSALLRTRSGSRTRTGTCRTVAPGAPDRLGQDLHLDEPRPLEPLDDQLGDPVAAVRVTASTRVVVDQQHLDLAAVARVDGARACSRWTGRGGRRGPSAGAPARRSRPGARARSRSAPGPARPGARVTSTVVIRSAPASPGCAYDGSGRPGSRRTTGNGQAGTVAAADSCTDSGSRVGHG